MKVNIVMSTYNGEAYLAEQIESIQRQSYTDWQLLIRDDGSSDDTPNIVKRFAACDERIHFINEADRSNYGVIKSFYYLIKHEKADYYFFCDQDDVWLPDKVETQLAAFAKEKAELPIMVYMDLKVVDSKLNIINDSMIRSQSHHANTQLVQELTENTVTGGVSAINHALAELWTSTDNIIMHDWYLALLASAFGKLIYLDKAGELYRQHGNNVLGARTWSKRIQKWLQPQLLFKKYWGLITASQKQASQLLALPLSPKKRELVEVFVGINAQPMLGRYRSLRRYHLRKNKWFHTLMFSTLIITKFAYKE